MEPSPLTAALQNTHQSILDLSPRDDGAVFKTAAGALGQERPSTVFVSRPGRRWTESVPRPKTPKISADSISEKASLCTRPKFEVETRER